MSDMKPVLHPEAVGDYSRYFEYLREKGASVKTLDDYLDAAEEAKLKIAQNPRTWSFSPGSKKVRRVHMRQFRMQVFYTIRSNGEALILEFCGPGAKPRWPERL